MGRIRLWMLRHRFRLVCDSCGRKNKCASVIEPRVLNFHYSPWFDCVSWQCFNCENIQLNFLTEAPEFVLLEALNKRRDLEFSIMDRADQHTMELHRRRFNVVMPAAYEPNIEAQVKAFCCELDPIVDAYHLKALS